MLNMVNAVTKQMQKHVIMLLRKSNNIEECCANQNHCYNLYNSNFINI